MKKRFIFVLGGARSGKSAHALSIAENLPGPRAYIATALALDAEMKERIRRHKEERGGAWKTIEEPLDPAGAVSGLDGGAAVLDCLTLWVSNLMAKEKADTEIEEEAKRLAKACKGSKSTIIAVSNEVGLGIVPDNALARRFRDLSGIVNRTIAQSADEVWFIAAGLSMKLK